MRAWEARLNHLRELRTAWNSGEEGEPITDIAFEVATKVLSSPAMYRFTTRPGIFATMTGGISLEMPPASGWDYEIEISSEGLITGDTEAFGLGPSLDVE